MSKYFTYFPKIYYNDQLSRNIIIRNKFKEENLTNPYLFLPYTVLETDRPEDIALYYYGDISYTWAILLANEMHDPYTDWIMTDQNLNLYIINKYEDLSGKTGQEVLDWSRNTLLYDNILYFEKDDVLYSPETVLINKATELNLTNLLETKIGKQTIFETGLDISYRPIRVYEYETLINENKRQILLIDKKYIENIEQSFYKLIQA